MKILVQCFNMKYQLKPLWIIVPLLLGFLAWFLTGNVAFGVAVFAVLLMPGMISIYVPYAKDNPRHYWFKRKLYGWGWTPVTWQGWLVTLFYIGIVLALSLTIDDASPSREIAFMFVLPFVVLTAAFLRIAYKTGEKPKWQWGVTKEEEAKDS